MDLEEKNTGEIYSEIKKPIFIVGVPRSGTSLLYLLLSQHPDLGCFTNNIIKKFLTDEYLKFVHLRRRIFELRKFPYPEDGFNERFFSNLEIPMEGGYLYDLVFKGSWDPKVSENNLAILKKTIIKTLSEQKRKRFLSKFPPNSIRINIINKIFQDAKFIHIIRDGRSVVNSLLERSKENPDGYFGIPLKTQETKSMNKIKKHALQWKQVIQEIRRTSKNLKKEQYMEIRYEDLIRSPDETLKNITEFCKLPQYHYVYEKDHCIFNNEGIEEIHGNFNDRFNMIACKVKLENKNLDPNLEYGKIFEFSKIRNKNTPHENDSEIKKYLSTELQELGYT